MPYRELLEEHLALVEKCIRAGAECLAAQNTIIERTRSQARDTQLAESVLHVLERSQAIQLADRDWIREQLARRSA